jgi:hypothetical protein
MSAIAVDHALPGTSKLAIQSLCTIELEGELTCVGPVAISPPDTYKIGGETKRMPRVTRDLASLRYIPASTLRHAIRHNIASVVFTALSAHGITLPLPAILAIDKGFIDMRKSDKSKADERDGRKGSRKGLVKAEAAAATVESAAPSKSKPKPLKPSAALKLEREIREKNPILSMLGSWMLPAELRIGNAMPRAIDAADYLGLSPGVVRMSLGDDTHAFLSSDDMGVYTTMLDNQNEASKKNEAANGVRKDDGSEPNETSGDVGLRHYSTYGYEYIKAGTTCGWNISLHRGDDDLRLGALLAGLRAWSHNTVIGAHKALGFGAVSAKFTVHAKVVNLLRAPSREVIGDVTIGNGSFALEGDHLVRALAVFDAAAEDGFRSAGLDFTVIPRASLELVTGKDAAAESGESECSGDGAAEDAE